MIASDCNWYPTDKNFDMQMTVLLVSNCRGLCTRYDITGGGKESAYKQGYKRCAVCEVYIKEPGVRCPCCGLPLRTRRRSW